MIYQPFSLIRDHHIQLTFRLRAIGHHVVRWSFESFELLHRRVQGPARLAELNHAGLEVGEWTLDEAILLLVVGEEVVPERVLMAA